MCFFERRTAHQFRLKIKKRTGENKDATIKNVLATLLHHFIWRRKVCNWGCILFIQILTSSRLLLMLRKNLWQTIYEWNSLRFWRIAHVVSCFRKSTSVTHFHTPLRTDFTRSLWKIYKKSNQDSTDTTGCKRSTMIFGIKPTGFSQMRWKDSIHTSTSCNAFHLELQ